MKQNHFSASKKLKAVNFNSEEFKAAHQLRSQEAVQVNLEEFRVVRQLRRSQGSTSTQRIQEALNAKLNCVLFLIRKSYTR